MDEKEKLLKDLITVETAINYTKASIYAMLKSPNGVNPNDIEDEILMHHKRYNGNIISILVKAYEKEEKKKCSK